MNNGFVSRIQVCFLCLAISFHQQQRYCTGAAAGTDGVTEGDNPDSIATETNNPQQWTYSPATDTSDQQALPDGTVPAGDITSDSNTPSRGNLQGNGQHVYTQTSMDRFQFVERHMVNVTHPSTSASRPQQPATGADSDANAATPIKDLWILGLFPFNGSWAGGLGQLPAVQMGIDDVNNDSTILPGYRLHLTVNNTGVSRV